MKSVLYHRVRRWRYYTDQYATGRASTAVTVLQRDAGSAINRVFCHDRRTLAARFTPFSGPADCCGAKFIAEWKNYNKQSNNLRRTATLYASTRHGRTDATAVTAYFANWMWRLTVEHPVIGAAAATAVHVICLCLVSTFRRRQQTTLTCTVASLRRNSTIMFFVVDFSPCYDDKE